ncbi:MAG: tRNA lysidine(34) synthetase TilS [Mariprofundaceae bacterium]|nr:tRNA lysidine(34) synthetase TilS [Mariprofundaceae bacterium]
MSLSGKAPVIAAAGQWFAGMALPDEAAVGWSGGADSTALLLALHTAGCRVQAWHIDHGWRDNSAEEAAFLAGQAAAWGIPFFHARLPVAPAANMEAAARKGRLAQFAAWRRQQGVDVLCLGHHREDQAETVCMRMLQGAGVSGCRGMRARHSLDGLNILRPLLHVPRRHLRAALCEAGVSWLEDVSNRDMRFMRNRIRHHLFPCMCAAGYDPVELYLRWQRQAGRLTEEIEAEMAGINITRDRAGVSVPWPDWIKCPAAVRARLLQGMMAALCGEGVVPGRRHILLVERWTAGGGRGGLDLSRCRLERRKGRLHLESAPPHSHR